MNQTAKPHLDSHMLPVFARADVAFERGEGPWLIATNGDRYLDFTSGVAVNALGHAHPHLVAALQEQAAKLWHVSNLFTIPEGEKLATRLCDASFADVAFFCNSGAEAGSRYQDGAQVSGSERPSGALTADYLRRCVSRTDAGDARRGRPAEISRRVRTAGRRFRSGSARRS